MFLPQSRSVVALALLSVFFSAVPGLANADSDLDSQVEQALADKLVDGTESGVEVAFGTPEIELSEEMKASGLSAGEIADQILFDLVSQATSQQSASTPSLSSRTGVVSPRGTGTYTSSVPNVVAIGVYWINQDFKATVTGSRMTSFSFLGSSYGTGIALSSWEHIRSTRGATRNNVFKITAKGVVHYIFKGSSIALPLEASRNWQINSSNVSKVTWK